MPYKLVSVCGFLLAFICAFTSRAFWIENPALWQDEIFTLLYSREELEHLLSLTRTSDVHPPLYYLVIKGAAALFGEGDGTKLRLISALASGLATGILFLLGRVRLGTGIAVISTLFFVLLPVNVHYGRELRTYSVLALALLSAVACFMEMTNDDHTRRSRQLFVFGYIVSLVVAFHLHYSAVVFFFLFGVAAFALKFIEADFDKLRLVLVATAIAGVLCLPQSVHFFWARAHTVGDFWIDPTSLRSFYSNSLGAYPFPSWGKLIIYPIYLVGTWFLWKLDRRLAVVVFTITVGGPITVALIGILSPAYLVRTIQAFTVLSPLLLAISVYALPRVPMLAAIVALTAIHILTIARDYPPRKEVLAIDRITPVVKEVEPEAVYYFSGLGRQIELRELKLEHWTPIALSDTHVLESITARMEQCAEQTCGPTVVVMERAPLFKLEEGRSWMAGMDTLAARFNAQTDIDVDGLRVLVLP